MTNLEEFWVDQVKNLLNEKPDGYIQIRKFFMGVEFYIPWEIFETGISMGYRDMGYSSEKNKEKQLIRNYFNEQELKALRSAFADRYSQLGKKGDQSCITARMGASKKDSRSQGYCMQCLTINHLERGNKERILDLEVYYRTTEVCQKFLADLKFLGEVVFPYLRDSKKAAWTPTGVRFRFSSLYLSLMYLPLLFQFENPYGILLNLKKEDPKYYKQVGPSVRRLLNPENRYSYRTRKLMHEFFRNRVYPDLSKQDVRKILKLVGD